MRSDCFAISDYQPIITSTNAASRFVTVSEDEIENFKENAVPKSTKEATKFGVKLLKGIKSNFQCYLIKCESIFNCN